MSNTYQTKLLQLFKLLTLNEALVIFIRIFAESSSSILHHANARDALKNL